MIGDRDTSCPAWSSGKAVSMAGNLVAIYIRSAGGFKSGKRGQLGSGKSKPHEGNHVDE